MRRPPLQPLDSSFDCVRECLKDCWAEKPEDRPDFKAIRAKLRPLRKGMRPNIFDNMMAMMEKYANNLEQLVDERTDQLQEEKKKTEALLLEMLPRPVAEQLKKGNKVEAETYDMVRDERLFIFLILINFSSCFDFFCFDFFHAPPSRLPFTSVILWVSQVSSNYEYIFFHVFLITRNCFTFLLFHRNVLQKYTVTSC